MEKARPCIIFLLKKSTQENDSCNHKFVQNGTTVMQKDKEADKKVWWSEDFVVKVWEREVCLKCMNCFEIWITKLWLFLVLQSTAQQPKVVEGYGKPCCALSGAAKWRWLKQRRKLYIFASWQIVHIAVLIPSFFMWTAYYFACKMVVTRANNGMATLLYRLYTSFAIL